MNSAGRYALSVLNGRQSGVPLASYPIIGLPQPEFATALEEDAGDLGYAGLVSLGEGLRGIKNKNYTWATVKLYYGCFYAIKAHLALDDVVIFHGGKAEYICDAKTGLVQELGRSSHQFSWTKISNIRRLSHWIYSEEAGGAFEKQRGARERANYKSTFSDPNTRSEVLDVLPKDLEKLYRSYKSDKELTYTFLSNHVALAFPIRSITSWSERYMQGSRRMSAARRNHLSKLWPFKEEGLW